MSALPMLSAAARSVLAAAIVDGNLVRLTSGQLARTLYEEVNEALVRIGGKWKNGKTQAHAFSYQDPAPLVAGLVASGVMPPKNPFAFFPTPPSVVESMLTSLDIDAFPSAEDDSYWSELGREGGLRILEPSAGTGAIADALRARLPRATLECCELNPLCAAVLRRKGYTVFEGDFLAFTPSAAYARIALNPPFSVKGDVRAYQSHIRHAHAMLAKGGSLVAIAPPGFLTGTSKADRAFRDFVYEHSQGYGVEEIPAGTFAASGTSIATVFMRLLAEPTGRAPVSGSHCWHCREAKLVGDSLRYFDGDRYELTDFVVMPNHVHLLAAFPDEQSMLAQCESWKHFTATQIHRRLGRRGRFWQQDGFDRLVRSAEHFDYLRRYIAENPARGKLGPEEVLHYSKRLTPQPPSP